MKRRSETQNKMKRPLILLLFTLALVMKVSATVSLPAILSDHMVLQKSANVPIWGKADPGEEVAVTLNHQTIRATTGPDGRWKTELNLENSGPGPFELVVSGRGAPLVISDVVIGEVWVASGQSNMELMLKDTIGAKEEIAGSSNPMLRQFLVKTVASREPLDDCTGVWAPAGPDTTGSFSAIGYYFAKRLQGELKVPIGLIHTSWGATPAEAWTSSRSLDTVPDLKASMERLREQKSPEGHVPKPLGTVPVFSSQILPPQKIAGQIFNGMINPLIPYAIRGVIWYQGEGNSDRAFQYRTTFSLLIKDWRERWGRVELAYYFCQLPNFGPKKPGPEESSWAELREAQSLALNLPHTGQAVLIDIGEADNIHPRNKHDAGERLALIALANDYGGKMPFSGPVYDSMITEPGRIRIKFHNSVGGLLAKPLPAVYDVNTLKAQTAPLVRNSPNSELEGFAICGEDRQWRWADAKIDGDTVLIWSNEIPAPVAVRYAWADDPTCNLYNSGGLPASPFRTDDFPLTTKDRKY